MQAVSSVGSSEEWGAGLSSVGGSVGRSAGRRVGRSVIKNASREVRGGV